ncbi:MAG: HAMP domain-containing sensor histidine kinase [Firmicutes bacterium]|nr:HAMP domain-containing sensor histidine kinase [Bacillota bacterium]
MSVKSRERGMFSLARRQLTLLLVAIVVMLYVATAVAVYEWMNQLTMSEVDTLLTVNARSVERRAILFMATTELSGVTPPAFAQSALLQNPYLVIRDAKGQTIYQSQTGLATLLAPLLFAPPLQVTQNQSATQAEILARVFHTVYWSAAHQPLRVMTVPVLLPQVGATGFIQVGMSMQEQADELARLRQVLGTVGALGAALALLLGFFASDRALQPIARSWKRQQEFVADASHELRTPLAVIQSNLDVVLSHADGTVLDNLEWLSNAKGESRRLVKLTEQLLTLARTDSSAAQIERGPTDLRALVLRAVESLAPLAEVKGVALRHEFEPDNPDAYALHADRERLYQLLVILIDNAIKYTDIGSIVIRLSRARAAIRIQVEDTGIGIAKEDLPHVFERFFRGDKSRERVQGGTGLGLAIAEWIATAHGGRVAVSSTLGQGAVFTITLPAVSTPPPPPQGDPGPVGTSEKP